MYIVLFLIFICNIQFSFADDPNDWRKDWTLLDNFTINRDTEGFHFPTAIAFVPNPGKGPKDPLYFVTELRGKVKVVTNDRTVYTFAEDFFKLQPTSELPSYSGESGLAGICLDPEHGFVFVTFAYQDENNVLRNNIVRFKSKPGKFTLTPISTLAFTEVFSREASAPSHQIGQCQIYDNFLYVGVGDGLDLRHSLVDKYSRSQEIDSLLGKILRMTIDGKPVKSNPYYVDDDIKKARNYVWAMGFRNPFGLKIVDQRVFVADNGPSVDRFLEVHEGKDYLWNGTNWSIGAKSAQIIAPSTGVVQLDYYPVALNTFPEEFRGKFYLALSGQTKIAGPSTSGGKSIIMLNYGFADNEMLSSPDYFLRYRGSRLQNVVGVSIGPDGLYFLPIFPDVDGRTAVLKVSYNRGSLHAYKFTNEISAPMILASKGCYDCHTLYENGWGTIGPNLDRAPLITRIEERLNSPEYTKQIKELDRLDTEPYKEYREVRKKIAEMEGLAKVRTWIVYHIIEPKFDNPESQMPDMGLTKHEAELVADFLIAEKERSDDDLRFSVRQTIKQYIPILRYRYLLYSFFLGFSVSILIAAVLMHYRKSR